MKQSFEDHLSTIAATQKRRRVLLSAADDPEYGAAAPSTHGVLRIVMS